VYTAAAGTSTLAVRGRLCICQFDAPQVIVSSCHCVPYRHPACAQLPHSLAPAFILHHQIGCKSRPGAGCRRIPQEREHLGAGKSLSRRNRIVATPAVTAQSVLPQRSLAPTTNKPVHTACASRAQWVHERSPPHRRPSVGLIERRPLMKKR
jgi:hypothetical protein